MLRICYSPPAKVFLPFALATSLITGGCDQPTNEKKSAAPVSAQAAAAPIQADAAPVQAAAAPIQAAAAPVQADAVRITYPMEGTLFPPDIVAPTFLWEDKATGVDRWQISVQGADGGDLLKASVDAQSWRPSEAKWQQIKQLGAERKVEVVVTGFSSTKSASRLSSGRVHIQTSTDPVGDSLFYREVPLPFLEAVQDPSRIRWRYGTIDMPEGPPIVLQDLPVCGNCHSFADNGSVLGLDVDYGNDKGAYAIIPVSTHMVMNDEKIITWADYSRQDGEITFGLLSRVSPDGRYVVSTVKDRSVFVALPDIMISQLFFPIKGILVVYDRETGNYSPLPGADDPQYVQSNAVWSPDGKELIFARSKAYHTKRLEQQNSAIVDESDVPEFTVDKQPFLYDLYRIPFNDGKGGTPEPVVGASANGMSNFFPKYSPDGKWIVFTMAKSYMLLQPDSELYIIPTEGGEARRLRYNTARMNSWHSWSSNSRWLVFSSKVNTAYTQLFLTHIDEDGNDSPAVLLERFTSPDRAANIPEFVNLPGDAIADIREEFLDAYSFLRAGMANQRTGDLEGAERAFRRGLELNPKDVELRNALGWALFQAARSADAVVEYEQALKLDPNHVKSHNNLALALVELGRYEEAAKHFEASLAIEPKAEIYSDLGFIKVRLGKSEEALELYQKALELDPASASAHFNMAAMLAQTSALADAESHYRQALPDSPSAEAHNGLGYVLARQGRTAEAVGHFRKAVEVDRHFIPAYNNLAGALAKQGKLEEAESYYRLSLAERPSASVHNALGIVLSRLGKTDEARKHLALAKSLASGE